MVVTTKMKEPTEKNHQRMPVLKTRPIPAKNRLSA
jgi:hypothetical protein